MSILDRLLIAVALVAGLWWGLSRLRRPVALQRLSVAAVAVAVTTVAVEGLRWQMVPWQVLAVAVGLAAALRDRRPGRSRRWARVAGRVALGSGLVVAGLASLTAVVPSLPEPTGPHHVGSEIFRWTDPGRAETLTPDPEDHREVVVQAWYPTDALEGEAVPYLEAQDELPGSIGGLPSFLYASFGEIETHATLGPPVSSAQKTWPVLIFSPGLSVPREEYTAISTDLASRGYVVITMSTPYESAPTVLDDGRVVPQTQHPDVMGPAPHVEIERLIDIRASDSSYVLDQLEALDRVEPDSPLIGHLDLKRVGIAGHSVGGATAIQAADADDRFALAVNLDGKLFGDQPDARPAGPVLWVQSADTKNAEYTDGRDRLLDGLGENATLLSIDGSSHMSFSDYPSYLTAAGRSVIGPAEATVEAADAIVEFAEPVFAR